MATIDVHAAEGFVVILVAWLMATELVENWSIPVDKFFFVIRDALSLYLVNTKW